MTRFENVGVFIREKNWLENSLSLLATVGVFIREKVWLDNSLSLLAQAILEPILFPYKYSNILKLIHFSYLPAYEDGKDRVFRNVGI